MSEFTVRPFQIEDLEPIVELQNLCMPQDAVTSNVFQRKVLLDPNLDLNGCLVAEEAGKQVGFILGLRRKFKIEDSPDDSDQSWITLFFVHPDYRRKGIGSALLDHCENFLRSEGRKSVWISSYAPNYFIPGVDVAAHAEAHQFLMKKGYTELLRPLAMDAFLVNMQMPEWVARKKMEREAEGYTFEWFSAKRTFAVMDHMRKCFPGDWQRFAREKMIAITTGQALCDEFAIAVKDDRVDGFAMYHGERFGPFGVDADLRGGGLGAVLLYMICDRMRARGMHSAWFLWTDDKVGKLYNAVCGFQETRRFALLRKVFQQ